MSKGEIKLIGIGVVIGVSLLWYLLKYIFTKVRDHHYEVKERKEANVTYKPVGMYFIILLGICEVIALGFAAVGCLTGEGDIILLLAVDLLLIVLFCVVLFALIKLMQFKRIGAIIAIYNAAFLCGAASGGVIAVLLTGDSFDPAAWLIALAIILFLIGRYCYKNFTPLKLDKYYHKWFGNEDPSNKIIVVSVILFLISFIFIAVASLITLLYY